MQILAEESAAAGDTHVSPARRHPYGYQLGDDAALLADPSTAPVVRRIFDEYAGGAGLQSIAERLTADGIPCPSAYDARRNPHHSGSAWSKVAVRAILVNDRYAGPGAAGSEPALIPTGVFRRSRDILARRGAAPAGGDPTRYALRGRVQCSLCHRLMQGTWNNGAAYYRCRFPREYARVNGIDHPANVYVRQDRLVTALESWIRRPLPRLLSEHARRQPPGVRIRWRGRAAALRALLTAPPGPDSGALYSALQLKLIYEPAGNAVEISTEALPGVLIVDRVPLRA